MMRLFLFLVWMSAMVTHVHSFTAKLERKTFRRGALRRMSHSDPSSMEHPCWQQIDDEDCAMDRAYAASFIAAEWMKGMPCAEGIADCDMPPELNTPHNRPEVDGSDVDVMDFLGLKRAVSLQMSHEKKTGGDSSIAP